MIPQQNLKSIIFAGGCFWGVQAYYNRVRGVMATACGYTGGKKEFPKYEEVCTQSTGHCEAVLVDYDPEQTNVIKLLDHFFHIVNPTTLNYQKGDTGTHYRSAIFYYDEEDKKIIEQYIDCIKDFYEDKIVTQVLQASDFWPAEDYHQEYLDNNPDGYCHINYTHFNRITLIDNYKSNLNTTVKNDQKK